MSLQLCIARKFVREKQNIFLHESVSSSLAAYGRIVHLHLPIENNLPVPPSRAKSASKILRTDRMPTDAITNEEFLEQTAFHFIWDIS